LSRLNNTRLVRSSPFAAAAPRACVAPSRSGALWAQQLQLARAISSVLPHAFASSHTSAKQSFIAAILAPKLAFSLCPNLCNQIEEQQQQLLNQHDKTESHCCNLSSVDALCSLFPS
jgi:hypothetical protein